MLKNKTLIIILIALLLLIPSIFMHVVLTQTEHQQQKQRMVTPTEEPDTQESQDDNPTPVYENTEQDKLLDYVQNRRTLSQTDKNAKAHILSLLPQKEDSGTLYETPDISIEYVHEPDLFQVEIRTPDIAYAKAKTVAWFKKQGVSQDGICKYPVSFYLNFDIIQQLKQRNERFNPLPDGC